GGTGFSPFVAKPGLHPKAGARAGRGVRGRAGDALRQPLARTGAAAAQSQEGQLHHFDALVSAVRGLFDLFFVGEGLPPDRQSLGRPSDSSCPTVLRPTRLSGRIGRGGSPRNPTEPRPARPVQLSWAPREAHP